MEDEKTNLLIISEALKKLGKKFLPLRRKPGMSSGTTAAASLRSPWANRARPQRSTAIV